MFHVSYKSYYHWQGPRAHDLPLHHGPLLTYPNSCKGLPGPFTFAPLEQAYNILNRAHPSTVNWYSCDFSLHPLKAPYGVPEISIAVEGCW